MEYVPLFNTTFCKFYPHLATSGQAVTLTFIHVVEKFTLTFLRYFGKITLIFLHICLFLTFTY